MTAPAPEVDDVFARMAPATRARALELRALVFDVAEAKGLSRPDETLKWGEPAYLPGAAGTTVRIGTDRAGGACKLLVNCRTSLVEEWRERFAGRLAFEGNRAVLVGTGGARAIELCYQAIGV